MDELRKELREIFNRAIDMPPNDRAAYLDSACGDDAPLRVDVESLLDHYEQDPDAGCSGASADLGRFKEGDDVGPYTILSTLGEGGMGVVYLARQNKPVQRRVALKVIKSGMDSKAVIARFEGERQALALMSHSCISKIFDAGMTSTSCPYFAMEFIDGSSITDACDTNGLDINSRLLLMAEVCDAVQHAHQKGVIHRDLKPGNILVSRGDDGHLHPTIIDFGVAKATGQELSEVPLVTYEGHVLGTPAYMSPEQADSNAAAIDTRSDVYALGVILYELLAGKPPFDSGWLLRAGLQEMRRIIHEEAPPRPSTWLSTSGDEATQIANDRQTDVSRLVRILGRELEWIPLKALRKRRSERYDSAKDLADDIRNYLSGKPLEAGPESTGYRLRKVVRRNTATFVAVAIVLLVLIAGIVSTSRFAIRADRERALATEKEAETAQELQRRDSLFDFLIMQRSRSHVGDAILQQHTEYQKFKFNHDLRSTANMTKDDLVLRLEILNFLQLTSESGFSEVGLSAMEDAIAALGETGTESFIPFAKLQLMSRQYATSGATSLEDLQTAYDLIPEEDTFNRARGLALLANQQLRVGPSVIAAEETWQLGRNNAREALSQLKDFPRTWHDQIRALRALRWHYMYRVGDWDSAHQVYQDGLMPLYAEIFEVGDIRLIEDEFHMTVGRPVLSEDDLSRSDELLGVLLNANGRTHNASWRWMNNLALAHMRFAGQRQLPQGVRETADAELLAGQRSEEVRAHQKLAADLWNQVLVEVAMRHPSQSWWYMNNYQVHLPQYAPSTEEYETWKKAMREPHWLNSAAEQSTNDE